MRCTEELAIRQKVGRYAQRLAPDYGHCRRCLLPWLFTQGHDTMYVEGTGCFPLCEKCWLELPAESRLPFYRELYELWQREDEHLETWSMIEAAVLEGK